MPHKSNKTMDDSGCPSSSHLSGSLRGLEDPSPSPINMLHLLSKTLSSPVVPGGGKSVNLPPFGAALINGKWAVLAAEARWQRRQSSGSKAAVAWRWQVARRRRRQREDNSGSVAAAGRCLRAHGSSSVAAMSGVEGRQDIGGSCYSRAVAAVAAWQCGICTRVLAAAQRWRQGSRVETPARGQQGGVTGGSALALAA
jgi:hypothetical protein